MELDAWAKEFFRKLIARVGLAFHIDTDPEEYLDSDGKPVFDPIAVSIINGTVIELFAKHDEGRLSDPYGLALDVMREMFPEEFLQ